MATICIKLHKTGQIAKAQLQPAEDIIKVDWIDKKTGGVIKEAHYHDEVILLVQTEGFDEGETITVKIKEKDAKEFEKGVFELNLSAQVDKESSARFEVPIPSTMKEGTLYVDEIECKESFRDVTLKIEDCVCREWETIAPVIPADKIVLYEHDCHAATRKQLSNFGFEESSIWNDRFIIAEGVYPKDSREPYTFKYFKEGFVEGVKYIKEALRQGLPITIGIDNRDDRDKKKEGEFTNLDFVTDHFVVIVGMGSDDIGKYFIFYDNADVKHGASLNNRLYCDCREYKISGYPDKNTAYLNKLNTVISIRKTLKKKKK